MNDAGPPPADLPKSVFHYVGRFDTRDALGPRFSWPGTTIRTRFSGTGVTVTLNETPSSSGRDQLDITIDGGAPTLLKTEIGTKTYTVASGLEDGEHDLVITKRTEALVGTLQLLAIESLEARPLVPTPAPATRFIEFVGDSITCGYGVLGSNPCPFTADTENESVAYGALTASLLGTDHAAISSSGIGVYRDFGGGTVNQMPTLFLRTLPGDPTSTWEFWYTPDVVVVNLGTNDFAQGDPGASYRDAMTSFAGVLRSKYPNTQLVLTVSSMMTGARRTSERSLLQEIVQTRKAGGDSKVSFFEFDEQLASDGYGCDSHPNRTTQRKSAEKLAAHVRSLTGW